MSGEVAEGELAGHPRVRQHLSVLEEADTPTIADAEVNNQIDGSTRIT